MGAEADIHHLGHLLAAQCDSHVEALAPLVSRYGQQPDDEPEQLAAQGLSEIRGGPVGLLRDLQDLYLLASFVDITWARLARLLGMPSSSVLSAAARSRPRCSGSGCAPALRRPHRKRWSAAELPAQPRYRRARVVRQSIDGQLNDDMVQTEQPGQPA